ncbi:helix-turn-helix domain-containing protein [Undibacterium sp. TS12]|uniref:helix-turn-helix domain-containing protein n=1 Tax=Undibacterium sp. TS12 TaxID=2908202 RepID=UPI001F4CDE9E|nr:helix-turn-helix domain-containing protein [Undibacterium sp. TS12]MCH8618037.1 helix-turn-helix domain-containing protein [Undibacterium sp. TS12]
MAPEDIIAIRKSIGLTQADFARLFDAHVMTISKWERGVVTPSPYQIGLMEHFRQKVSAEQARARTEVKQLLINAGVIAALIWLLSQTKK